MLFNIGNVPFAGLKVRQDALPLPVNNHPYVIGIFKNTDRDLLLENIKEHFEGLIDCDAQKCIWIVKHWKELELLPEDLRDKICEYCIRHNQRNDDLFNEKIHEPLYNDKKPLYNDIKIDYYHAIDFNNQPNEKRYKEYNYNDVKHPIKIKKIEKYDYIIHLNPNRRNDDLIAKINNIMLNALPGLHDFNRNPEKTQLPLLTEGESSSKKSKTDSEPPHDNPEVNQQEEDLERKCKVLLQEVHSNTFTTYPQILGLIRERAESFVGFGKPEQALVKYPHLKSVKKVAKILLFPRLAEAKFAVSRHPATSLGGGTSGTYLMKGRDGNPIGIFKPDNEAVGAPKNPRGYSREPLNREIGMASTDPFDFSIREEMAYVLDRGFASVPKTKVVSMRLFKAGNPFELNPAKVRGSFQVFVNNSTKLSEIDTIFLETDLSIKTVHRMGILDIRLLNADRHFGNVLLNHNIQTLIPIDHGLILPPKASRLVFEWMTLPQSGLPFREEELEYIESLKPEEDAELLRLRGFACEKSIQRMIIATYLLKECARQNFTLREIGNLMISGKRKEWSTKSGSFISYFEHSICDPIIEYFADRDTVIAQSIQRYKSDTSPFVLGLPPPYFQISETLVDKEDIRLIRISGNIKVLGSNRLYELTMQDICILSIARSRLGHDLEIRPLQTKDFSADGEMLSITNLADKSKNLLAAVNGGFFHYGQYGIAGYDWKGFFKKGDPVGALVQNGKVESENPKGKRLWGKLSVKENGAVEILEDEKDVLAEASKHALGSAPVLIRNGRLYPLQRDIHQPKPQRWNPPGDFQTHIYGLEPRTVVALTKDTVLFVTVDGRRNNAKGMTGAQLTDFLRNINFGVTDALNLDGGGSTAMWIRGFNFVNKPQEERPLSNVLALLTKENK